MANFGRFACVLLPFLLTLASLIALLVAGLGGVTDKSLYMFEIITKNLSMSPESVVGILDGSEKLEIPRVSDVIGTWNRARQEQSGNNNNLTAADLGLYDQYDVSVWGYCYTAQNGTRECTEPSFNWAAETLNSTTGKLNSMLTSTGTNLTVPEEITDAIHVFSTASRWTQIVFIISYIALGVALFFGIFANCSRIFSCITWLIAAFAAVAVGAAAALTTATSAVVVGAIETAASEYKVEANFNRRFLVTVWIAAAFAIGAALFWLFTICCCAPDRSSRRGDAAASEKLAPATGYQRLSEPNGYQGYSQPYAREYPAPSRESAYEPYSHTRV